MIERSELLRPSRGEHYELAPNANTAIETVPTSNFPKWVSAIVDNIFRTMQAL